MEDEIKKLEEEISKLPIGYISNKTINGKLRHYRQWTENGKVKSEYIPDNEFENTRQAIEKRKVLQKHLRDLTGKRRINTKRKESYEMNVITGQALHELVKYVSSWRKRDCYSGIVKFLYGKVTPRVCSVYGLRRTGKTTMLHQAICEMSEQDLAITAYIKARKNQTMSMLDRDLKKLYENGYRYIFIDEITFLEEFVDTASFLSDIYAAMGMKIVLSGTDSLGLWFAAHEELYDRAYTIHTTWIPFSEYAGLLGIDDVDEYIRYGGTLRVGETDFDDPELRSEEVSFRDDESTRRYIDTAICGNIQHSLKCYENGTHFRHLQELYDAHELTGAINRIIENMNHRFVVEVLKKDFESSDLKLAKKNLLRERNPELRNDVLERINIRTVTERLMQILEIRNSKYRSVQITDAHTTEIKEYLKALELIETSIIRYDATTDEKENILFTQPGMRYCQAQALVYSLKKDSIFEELNETEKNYVCDKILDEVKGRMLEEIVLHETMRRTENFAEVFKYQFVSGEFDMVVYDKNNHNCRIYEIKHSKERTEEQRRHLNDFVKCNSVEKKFGEIKGKYVLYRGETFNANREIKYINAAEYLNGLPDILMSDKMIDNELPDGDIEENPEADYPPELKM